jgi:hypothetical protein
LIAQLYCLYGNPWRCDRLIIIKTHPTRPANAEYMSSIKDEYLENSIAILVPIIMAIGINKLNTVKLLETISFTFFFDRFNHISANFAHMSN